MWSGLNALDKLDSTLHSLRTEAVRVDQQLAQLSQRYAGAEQRRMHIVYEIARVRLAGIGDGDLDVSLTEADREVQRLLEQRSQALSALNEQIEAASVLTQQLETARLDQLGRVNEVSKSMADTQVRVQESLTTDQEYLDLLSQATRAESIMLESHAKVDVAKSNMAEKAIPYQSDELFTYLWNRGYGTTEYKAGLIARWLDAKVAKLIKYEPARVNYWNLTQIPKRLQQHAENVAEKADEQVQAVEAFEAARLDAAGMGALNAQIDTLRSELDRLDDKLEQCEADLNEFLQERSLFIAGDDKFSKQGLSRLAQAMDHRDLDSVYRYVLATSSLSDDQLVIELSDLDQQCRALKADTQDLRKSYNGQISRLKDIEGVRRNFKNARFDDVSSGFENQELVLAALGQFVQGVLSGGDLWGVIKRNQRYSSMRNKRDSNTGFGSDSLRRSARSAGRRVPRAKSKGRDAVSGSGSSSWKWIQPRSQRGRIKMPKSPSSSGGFKTGGSF